MQRKPRNRTLRDRIIVVVFSITLLAVFISLVYRERMKVSEVVGAEPLTVSAVRPERNDLKRTLTYTAVLDAESSITVLPRISGTVIEVLVEEGALLRPGDLLARIDPEPYRLEMKAAESAWLLAESSYRRIEKLHQGAGASRQQLDEAVANRDGALSSYELSRMQFEYSEVRSPVGGIVLSRFTDEGKLASPEQPMFVVGNDGSYRVSVRVPEKHWAEFDDNPDIRALLVRDRQGPEPPVPAEILRISPSISPADRTFRVTCSADRDSISWPLGSRISVTFVLEEKQSVWTLPLEVLDGNQGVWWVRNDGSTAQRITNPVSLSDGRYAQIPESWSDRIFVLEGQHRLKDNDNVRVFFRDSGK